MRCLVVSDLHYSLPQFDWRWETTACTTADSVKPRINGHRISHPMARVAELDAHPQPFALRAEIIEGGRPRMRYSNSVLCCALADIIGILGRPDNAGRIHRR
jgi:hypothetical protein